MRVLYEREYVRECEGEFIQYLTLSFFYSLMLEKERERYERHFDEFNKDMEVEENIVDKGMC